MIEGGFDDGPKLIVLCVCVLFILYALYFRVWQKSIFPRYSAVWPDVSAKPSSRSNVPSLSPSPHLSANSPPLLLSLSPCRVSLITSQWNTPTGQSPTVPSHLVLATGLGNPPAVRVRTGQMVPFGCRTVQKPDPQCLGDSNPDPYPSTCRFYQVWIDPSGPISGSVLLVFPFMIAFRYTTANCKTLTFACYCPFRMNRPPL